MAVHEPKLRWIQLIGPTESVIQLNDGQIYEVNPGGEDVVSGWTPPEYVDIDKRPGDPKYPCVLINQDQEESVRIRQIDSFNRKAV